MKLWINRDGHIVTKPTAAGLLLPDSENAAVNVRELGPLVYLVRFEDELEVHLAVFRKDIALMPRLIKLHNVPDKKETVELTESVFTRLLGFDGNRLSNRDRNISLPILRPMCSEQFKGSIDTSGGTFQYTLYKNLLTIFNSQGQGLIRTNYIKLSRSIKDKL